jgi:hypothetical protein
MQGSKNQCSVVTQVTWAGCLTAMVIICGLFGFTSDGGLGKGISPKATRVLNVLRAAPSRYRFFTPDIWQSMHWYWPPAYTNGMSANTHFVQLKLSSRRGPPMPRIVEPDDAVDSSAMTGVFPLPITIGGGDDGTWAKTDCTKVDVWMPKNVDTHPITNQSNGERIHLRITPPSSGVTGNCTVWEYH